MPFEISKDVLFQELAGETVLLDLGSDQYFGLNEVGTRIWQALNEGAGQGDIVDRVLDEFDVDRATAEQDVSNLLSSLQDAGLISPG